MAPKPCHAQVEVHESEGALLDGLVAALRALDPDILVGFEVQQGSLGYLSDRAAALARPEPLLRQLSRTPQVPRRRYSRLALPAPQSFLLLPPAPPAPRHALQTRACRVCLFVCSCASCAVAVHLFCEPR